MSEETLLNEFHDQISHDLLGRDFLRCLLLREKLYKLKPKLYQFIFNVVRGNWSTAVRFNRFFPPDGDENKIDPSLLLFVISKCDWGRISRKANRVRIIRNHCYGHIPQLKLTDTLISNIPTSHRIPATFGSLIGEVDALICILR
jgi:hypothetical protein